MLFYLRKIIETPPIWFIAFTLILGAACLGVSPLFVRISEVGPASSAFWRSFLALPFILILIKSINIKTAPYPGFPTDLQAQFMSLMCIANGKSVIEENIFENRFMHIPELSKMKASIKINGNQAIVKGLKQLQGASVKATDLRASMSLIAAGLNANGESVVNDLSHLKRGYENFEEKLFNIGAHIR